MLIAPFGRLTLHIHEVTMRGVSPSSPGIAPHVAHNRVRQVEDAPFRGSSQITDILVTIQDGHVKAGRTGCPASVWSSAENSSIPCLRKVER